jgi:hypothetical protein
LRHEIPGRNLGSREEAWRADEVEIGLPVEDAETLAGRIAVRMQARGLCSI